MSLVNTNTPFPSIDRFFELKQLNPTSVRKYRNSIDLIRKVVKYDKDDIGFINRVQTFVRHIGKHGYSMNTIKSVYIVWYSLVNVFPEFCYRRTIDDVRELMSKYNNMSSAEMAKNKPSSSDYMEIDDIREMVSSMPNGTHNEYMDKLIVALYSYLPPVRLDYADMRVYSREYKAKSETENYCVFNKNGFYFVLNHFKTKQTIGRFVSQVVEPSTPLYRYLKFWFENFNTSKKWLLATEDDPQKSISRQMLGVRLKNAFKKYANKNIGIRQLRRIYETELTTSLEYTEMTLEEKKEAHRQLLHSFEMGNAYAIHGDSSDDE